ncbi:MAG TPA: helix-turn-helix domain-containing protein, partial [Polyangiaceae bacterium]|nr:helix-turn-helix domain-containing protein [Polyangiaceae bacterium]
TPHHLVVELETQTGSPRSVADCSLLAYLLFLRRWTGEDFAAREVYFQHARPARVSAYERWFRCPVHFGHTSNTIAFDRDVAALPLVTAQSDVAVYLEEQASSLLASVPPERGAHAVGVGEIRAAVREGVREGNAHLTVIARRLGVGPRHMQRLLARNDLDYRMLLDEARHAAALPLVTESDTPFEIIAERVGFTESRAFRRAFRRWVGISPSELRMRHRSSR